ncbi:hypothetical protein AAG906_009623 [Vitis piasezkii]
MTSNLRASFKERQCKRLSESFPTASPPAKRTCSRSLPKCQFDQALIVSSSAEKDVYPVLEMTSIGQTAGNDLTDKNAPISSPVLGWDEITTLLKQVSCFTTPEFFVDMLGNPPITAAPCLPHDTPEYFLLCIQPMQQYTAVETTEVAVAVIHNMMRQRTMRAFFTQRLDNNKELRTRQAVSATGCHSKSHHRRGEVMRDERETAEAKCKDVE